MTLKDIAHTRLYNQQLTKTDFKTPGDLVSWMGVMQAQDYAMSKWAVGIRLKNSSVEEVESALNKAEIIRTHVLRPTWHLVSPEDVYWMLDLSATKIRTLMRSNNKTLELSDSVFKKSRSILEKSLVKAVDLTREEISLAFNKAKIKTDNNRLSHILLDAELQGLICSGKSKGNKQTYALLEERVPRKEIIKKEEALQRLVGKYFRSHGPATLKDFIWWSGLAVKDARLALRLIEKDLFSETIGAEIYWFSEKLELAKTGSKITFLLPAYDEYLISYKDRTASITNSAHKGISINGIFYPIILVNGQALGTWKRSVKQDELFVELSYFQKAKNPRKLIEVSADKLKEFLGLRKLIVEEQS